MMYVARVGERVRISDGGLYEGMLVRVVAVLNDRYIVTDEADSGERSIRLDGVTPAAGVVEHPATAIVELTLRLRDLLDRLDAFQELIDAIVAYAAAHDVPMTEVRQIAQDVMGRWINENLSED